MSRLFCSFSTIILLNFGCFVASYCFAQGYVTKDSPIDHREHLLDSSFLYFTVGCDGKMSRIDVVSDPGASWKSSGLLSSSARFIGTRDLSDVGTFAPRFSGEVTIVGGKGRSQPIEYEWKARAKYNIKGSINIKMKPFEHLDFEGRSYTVFGLGEYGTVEIITDPPNLDITDLKITSSNTNVCTVDHHVNTYYDIDKWNYKIKRNPGSAILKAEAKIADQTVQATCHLSAIAPEGVYLVKERNVTLHDETVGARFEAKYYVLPTYVTFNELLMGEGDAKPDTRGSQDTEEYRGKNHGWQTPAYPKMPNIVTGCRWMADTVACSHRPIDVEKGSFSWNIPIYYRDDNQKDWHFIFFVKHLGEFDGHGKCTLTKAGASAIRVPKNQQEYDNDPKTYKGGFRYIDDK